MKRSKKKGITKIVIMLVASLLILCMYIVGLSVKNANLSFIGNYRYNSSEVQLGIAGNSTDDRYISHALGGLTALVIRIPWKHL